MKYLAWTLFIGLIAVVLISSCDPNQMDRSVASTSSTNSIIKETQTVPDNSHITHTNTVSIMDNTSSNPFIGKHTGLRIFESSPEDITPENYPDIIESFVFPNAELKDVIKAMSTDMNINIIMNPDIANKKISIISYSPITVAEAYHAFLSALAVHGLTVVPSGSFVKIVSKEIALKSNVHVHTKATPVKTDQFITQIIKLKHISAESLEQKIKPFIDSKSVQSMIFYEPSNMVIISDHGLNVERFHKIIKALDSPTKEIIFKVIPIKHAEASKLSTIVSNLLSGSVYSSNNYSFKNRRGRNTYQIKQDGVKIKSLFHDERTNSIIAMGNKKGIKKVERLVEQLDYYKDPALAGGIFVYRVKHGTARELAGTLNTVIGKESLASGVQRGRGRYRHTPSLYRGRRRTGVISNLPSNMQEVDTARSFKDVRIIAENNTNSLLIVANKYDYETILDILNKVDISRNQVFIKTIIMELNTDKNKDWKIANYFFPKDGKGLVRMGYGLSDLSDLTSPSGATLMFPLSLILDKSLTGISATDTTEVNPLFLGQISPRGSKVFSIPSLSSFVQFLQKNIGANILSTPQVMALDHQQAIDTINENIPVVGTLVQYGVGTNALPGANINYKNVETALKITPHINPDVSSVRLKIEQKIDSIIKEADVPKQVQDAAVSIKKRTIKTNITLKDKETAVLGGLVKESNTKNESKIPILGDLPIVGWLFKNSETNRKKSNLIVFISPQIIRSAEEHQGLLNSKLKERMEFIRHYVGDKDPYQSITKQMQTKKPVIPKNDMTPDTNFDASLEETLDSSSSDTMDETLDSSSDETANEAPDITPDINSSEIKNEKTDSAAKKPHHQENPSTIHPLEEDPALEENILPDEESNPAISETPNASSTNSKENSESKKTEKPAIPVEEHLLFPPIH